MSSPHSYLTSIHTIYLYCAVWSYYTTWQTGRAIGIGRLCYGIGDLQIIRVFVQESLEERIKRYRSWKDDEVNLAKKREVKVRLELAHKTDKVNEANREITEVLECDYSTQTEQTFPSLTSRHVPISPVLWDEQQRFSGRKCKLHHCGKSIHRLLCRSRKN